MNGNRSYAWVVAIANDDSIENALASGETLRRTDTSGALLALVSNSISKSNISELESAFDLVIVKDVESLSKKLGVSKGISSDLDTLLISALNMTTFSKLVIIRPGVLVLQQSDKLFDFDDQTILDKHGRWEATVISPDKKKYIKVLEKLQTNGLTWKSPLDVMNLVFSGNWKRFADPFIVYREPNEITNGLPKNLKDLSFGTGPCFPNNNHEDTQDWVAIVGMSCRFPDANSTEEYWDLLASGRNACVFPPDHRTKLIDLDPKLKANFLKCPIDQFDATFFGYSPSEAIFTDPQARLLLEVSWEAFEDASMNPEVLKGTQTGVFYGSWLQEYRDAMNADGSPANEDFIRKYLGNSFGCSAAKLSFFYGFTGPNVATESGCSSSMVAVDLAVKSLQKRECPVAMVAGANVLLHMNTKQKVLWAEDGKSRTFDADANGYARAEGVAALILKRYSDAKRDGDRVHAIIRGTAMSQEGLSKSFGTPTVDSECAAMRGALKSARVEPWEVDYVEAHATGTAVGDPIEAQAIVRAYSEAGAGTKIRRAKPLYIGSGKTNVGHTESCSGMAGIFKVVLAMKNEKIPAHLNLNRVNPQVNFEGIPGEIPVEAVPWRREESGKPRIAGVSSFGITGTDVHVIIQEAPEDKDNLNQKMEGMPPPLQVLTISAKSEGALEEFAQKYMSHLETSVEDLEDITYSANACRPHHPLRMAIVGENKSEMISNIQEGNFCRGKANPPKICFTFPGRIGLMDLEPARILYRTSQIFKDNMDYCDKLFIANTGMTLIPLLTNVEEDTLIKGVAWYALIPAMQYSLVKLWASWGIHPDCVMGHCIGEISAAVISGALPIEDVFKMVKSMEYFLEVGREQPALMMAIQASSEKTEELITSFLGNNNNEKDHKGKWIDVASSNAFDQTVVAGDTDSIPKFKEFLKTYGLRCKILIMDFCAHSRAVEPACQQSLEIFEAVPHQKMKIPYVSSVTGKVVKDEDMGGQYWYQVFRQCVNFTESCRTTSSSGLADVYIEMGLEGALSRLTQENLASLGGSSPSPRPVVCLPSMWKVKGDKCWAGLLTSLGQLYALGGNVDWNSYYGNGHYKKVKLPQYPFQRKSFWYERKKRRVEESEGVNHQEIMNMTQLERVHPLLGAPVDTCVENPLVFQNWISGEDTVKYIYDHVIGEHVIFPGAGFLEMILAGVGQAYKQHDWIQVEGFTVNSPLHLEGSTPKRMQCMIDRKTQTGRVYAWHKKEKRSPWKLHSGGEYKLEVGVEEMEGKIENVEEIKYRCVEKLEGTDEFYLAAKQVGLNFGNDFRSMKKIFLGEIESETLIEIGLPTNNETEEGYICHPILIDAMIQGLILHTKPELKKLHVPVKIGKFLVKKGMTGGKKWYVHCKKEPDSGLTKHVKLLNESGVVVASMTNAELVMTSIESVLKAAGCISTKEMEKSEREVIDLHQYNVLWKRGDFHQNGNSIQLQCTQQDETKRLLGNLQEILLRANKFSEEESLLDERMNRLCRLYVLKALFELGWTPSDGLENLIRDATEKWHLLPELMPAFKHFITYLDSEDVTESARDYDQVITEINKTLLELEDYGALKTVQACGSQLAGILNGNVNPHVLLFGSTANPAAGNLAEHFYRETRFRKVGESLIEVFKLIYEQVQKSRRSSSEVVRILEVGAGTGTFADGSRSFFKEMGTKYEYTFTDISPSFLVKAKERFGEEPFIFKAFNIEMDPLKQGFSPEYYDVVVAMDVVHATKKVHESLANMEMVTKPGGWVILGETAKPVREVDICFGILEGYWLFEDGIRKEHCTLSGEKWLELLHHTGFTRAQGSFLSCNSQMSVIAAQKGDEKKRLDVLEDGCRGNWLVVSDNEDDRLVAMDAFTEMMKSAKRKVAYAELNSLVNLGENENKLLPESLEGIIFWMGGNRRSLDNGPDSRQVLEPMLSLAKFLLQRKWKILPRFHLVTNGCLNTVAEVDCHGYGDPNTAQCWGFLRNMRIELPGILSKSIDLEIGGDVRKQCLQLMLELWLDDKETEVAYRGGVRYLRRASQKELVSENNDIGIQGNGRYYTVELPKSKVIKDVRFVKMEEPSRLADDEILVEVKSVSLNFKDVLAVMKPSPDFEQLTSIGLDFSGVVVSTGSKVTKWRVGQSIFGCGWEQGAMKSHVVTKEEAVVSVPERMTFNEAATLPAVWLTAWYCMVEIAKLRKDQTVLVHAASGGVGLIAIQLAKYLGAKVIGTAGTEKKRSFVRSLGVEHVFNSRTTEFGQEIEKITGGKGVDMVLNCLTGPGFKEASLQICKDGGHFVEISKLDIWTNDQVFERRPEVNYSIVDVTQVDKAVLQRIMDTLTELLDKDIIKPLPYTMYPASEIRDALTYLQKAKQIGKVILTMPKFEGNAEEGVDGYHKEYLFNDRSTYLITGGKGAIGLSVAKWMVTQGAKYLVLVGRSKATESVEEVIQEMEELYGAKVICREIDITDMEQCRNLIQEFNNRHDNPLPPVRGIHHCAGILSDKLLSQVESWSSYETVIRPKVEGAWNLHHLTKDLNMEFFVLYSSAASTFGNIGQSSYVAANSYLDSLADMRVSMGLPCLSVNWGQWKMGFAKDLNVEWLHPFTADEGVKALGKLMISKPLPNVTTGLFNFYGLMKMTPYYKDTFFKTFDLDHASFYGREQNGPGSDQNKNGGGGGGVKTVLLIDQYQILEDEEQRNQLVREFVVRILCETLGTKPEEIRDDDQHFSEMGMDSLMSIEFANKINSEMEGGSGGGGFIDLEEFGTVSNMTGLICETLGKLIL